MDDFIDGAVTPIVEQEIIPPSKTFKPWHKPRKQWCRYHQWYKTMNWIVDSLDRARSKEFKYLGLPGDELIDLRMFARGCSAKEIGLKYLGFNTIADKEKGSSELALSESELNKTGVIAPGSSVLQEPLESLSSVNSSAYGAAKSFMGFHMINFDLCSSIAVRPASHPGDTYFKALTNLVHLQTNFMTESWSLFITTSVERRVIVEDVMVRLLGAIKKNVNKHEIFSGEMNKTLFVDTDKLDGAIVDLNSLSNDEFFDLFALGLSKWLLQVVFNRNSSWKISMVPSCKYVTAYHDGNFNMLSIGFRFKYDPQDAANDPNGLGSQVQDNSHLLELNCALPMIRSVGEIINLDQMLESDPANMKLLIEASAQLLAQARYNSDHYKDWVNQGCPPQ